MIPWLLIVIGVALWLCGSYHAVSYLKRVDHPRAVTYEDDE